MNTNSYEIKNLSFNVYAKGEKLFLKSNDITCPYSSLPPIMKENFKRYFRSNSYISER